MKVYSIRKLIEPYSGDFYNFKDKSYTYYLDCKDKFSEVLPPGIENNPYVEIQTHSVKEANTIIQNNSMAIHGVLVNKELLFKEK